MLLMIVPKCDQNGLKTEQNVNENHSKPETSDSGIAEGRQGGDITRERT
jgi:hypothetical protein